MKILLLPLFIFFTYNLSAQNMVPDPGFEIVRRMPSKHNNGVTCTKYWMSPTGDGASDYYYKGTGRHCGTPKNIFGRQKPHSGKAYGGICVRRKFIEYLETKLSDTLTKDQDYLVEFYISPAERSIGGVREFGVLFSKKNKFGLPGLGITTQPSVDFARRKRYKNKKKWTKLSGIYRAEGNETVLILGYFNYNKSRKFRGLAHYYVDDVSVRAIKTIEDSVVNIIHTDSINITEKEPDNLSPKIFEPKTDEVVILKNVFFESNKAELLPESFEELNKLVEYLSQHSNRLIEISGHTDNSGNEERNKSLSQLRAKAVADYLISNEIDSSRIKYIGYGSSKPIASNEMAEGKQQNRRVEFILSIK